MAHDYNRQISPTVQRILYMVMLFSGVGTAAIVTVLALVYYGIVPISVVR